MPTNRELEKLLASTETCRVGRTKPTPGKDKFGEVVCAFLNKDGGTIVFGVTSKEGLSFEIGTSRSAA